MYGSGPFDDDYTPPPSIPSVEKQRKMIEQSTKANEKKINKEKRKRQINEMKRKIKGSLGRGVKRVGRLFSRNNRSSRPRTETSQKNNIGGPPVSAVVLNEGSSGYHHRMVGGRKRKRINRTTRKPIKRTTRKPKKSKRTRRLKR